MKALLTTLPLKSLKSNSSAGFSLMELFVVLVIMGLLAAFAGPSWLAFLNSRRAADSANQILESMRNAQSDAAKTRRPHVLELNPDNADPPSLRFGTLNGSVNDRAISVLGGSDSKPGLIKLEALDTDSTPVEEIQFTGQGNLDTDFLRENNYDLPIYLTVIVPNPDTQTNPNGKKRCVIIETLLGAARDGKDEECTP